MHRSIGTTSGNAKDGREWKNHQEINYQVHSSGAFLFKSSAHVCSLHPVVLTTLRTKSESKKRQQEQVSGRFK